MLEIQGKYSKATIFTENIEESCISQIYTMINHPAFTEPVAIMPDCHAGKGSVIGFTMPLTDMVVPNVIGLDIGCGMYAVKMKRPKNMNLEELDKAIRNRIPFGPNVRLENETFNKLTENTSFFNMVQASLYQMSIKLKEKFNIKMVEPPKITFNWFEKKCEEIGQSFTRAQTSIGTLGGGNHFIEFGVSTKGENDLWIIVHSGSRQFGKNICDYHQAIAVKQQQQAIEGDYQEQIEHIKKTSHTKDIQKKISELRANRGIATGIKQKGLESLTGKEMYNYLYDMVFAQFYASLNRDAIMLDILDIVIPKPKFTTKAKPRLLNMDRTRGAILEEIETIHNYIDSKDLIIRKGAVAAYPHQKIVIPFNMKDGTWICTGQGDEMWNFSAPHGAGRIMSRSQAKRELKQEDANKAMEGIYTSCIPLDEAPGAYKNASEIKSNITATAGLVEEIKPIMNLKAE